MNAIAIMEIACQIRYVLIPLDPLNAGSVSGDSLEIKKWDAQIDPEFARTGQFAMKMPNVSNLRDSNITFVNVRLAGRDRVKFAAQILIWMLGPIKICLVKRKNAGNVE